MEKLIHSQKNFLDVLYVFENTLTVFKRPNLDDDLKSIIMTSLIKNNEMCYEALLKFLDIFLIDKLGIKITGKDRSKNIIRECLLNNLIDEISAIELLDLNAIRNFTVHEYNEESMLEHIEKIETYFCIFKKLEFIGNKELVTTQLLVN